jgi:hypothetical protein
MKVNVLKWHLVLMQIESTFISQFLDRRQKHPYFGCMKMEIRK